MTRKSKPVHETGATPLHAVGYAPGGTAVGSPPRALRRARMATAIAAVWVGLVVAYLPGQAKAWPGSFCNVYGGDQLRCSFGLELWEDGKKATDTFEQWSLECLGTTTSCTLEQTIFTISSTSGSLVATFQYSDSNANHSDRL